MPYSTMVYYAVLVFIDFSTSEKRKYDDSSQNIVDPFSSVVFFLVGIIVYWDFVSISVLLCIAMVSLHAVMAITPKSYGRSTQIKFAIKTQEHTTLMD